MNYFDILFAKSLGGGGSSDGGVDLHTFNVTFINNSSDNIKIIIPFLYDDGDGHISGWGEIWLDKYVDNMYQIIGYWDDEWVSEARCLDEQYQTLDLNSYSITTTGEITTGADGYIYIRGDGSVMFKDIGDPVE